MDISGAQRLFYVLRLMDTDMTIMIPQDNAVSVGMRSLIAPKEVPKIIKLLKEKKRPKDKGPDQTWNRRQREYTDKIKTGIRFMRSRPCSANYTCLSWIKT